MDKIRAWNSTLHVGKPLNQRTTLKAKTTLKQHGKRFASMLDRTIQWSCAVVERHDHRCFWCHRHDNNLDAHHIWSKGAFPEYRFILENGVALCRICHSRLHSNHQFKTEIEIALDAISLKERFDRGDCTIIGGE